MPTTRRSAKPQPGERTLPAALAAPALSAGALSAAPMGAVAAAQAAAPARRRGAAGAAGPASAAAGSAVRAEALRLAPRALYQEVAERLREAIFARQLEPGSWIDEQKLAADYGISRTPLREALKVLAVEGLVTMKVRRGAYVTEMSRADVEQVYHLLALLESDAAASVARRAGAAERAELEALHQQLERQTKSRDAFFAANERFHMALLHIAGNRWAEQAVIDLRKVMKLNRHHSLFKQGRIAESLAEHRELMRAIGARDALAASRLMRAHFAAGLEAAAPAPARPAAGALASQAG